MTDIGYAVVCDTTTPSPSCEHIRPPDGSATVSYHTAAYTHVSIHHSEIVCSHQITVVASRYQRKKMREDNTNNNGEDDNKSKSCNLALVVFLAGIKSCGFF